MADVIGLNHGAEAVRQRLNAVDPNKQAYNIFFGQPTATREGTVRKLIDGHNEVFAPGGLKEDVTDIKRMLARRPF